MIHLICPVTFIGGSGSVDDGGQNSSSRTPVEDLIASKQVGVLLNKNDVGDFYFGDWKLDTKLFLSCQMFKAKSFVALVILTTY